MCTVVPVLCVFFSLTFVPVPFQKNFNTLIGIRFPPVPTENSIIIHIRLKTHSTLFLTEQLSAANATICGTFHLFEQKNLFWFLWTKYTNFYPVHWRDFILKQSSVTTIEENNSRQKKRKLDDHLLQREVIKQIIVQ